MFDDLGFGGFGRSLAIVSDKAPQKRRQASAKLPNREVSVMSPEKISERSTATRIMDRERQSRSVSAAFKTESSLDRAICDLLESGIDRERIAFVGRNFETQNRIRGFITREGIVLDGLKQGTIFGTLFDSFLSRLTGVGVLFVPLVGSVVVAGPLGTALLGMSADRLRNSAGAAGLATALIALGMPKEMAAIYETRIRAGEFLLAVEVPVERAAAAEATLREAGGDDLLSCSAAIAPPVKRGLMRSGDDIPPDLRAYLSEPAREAFVGSYNRALSRTDDATFAMTRAWEWVEERFERNAEGVWILPPES